MGCKWNWFLCAGPRLTWFQCGGRSCLLVFFCAGRKWLVCNVGIDWLGFLCGWSNLINFCMPTENRLVVVWASNLTSILCGGSKWTWFQCGGSNSTWFQRWDRNWLGFYVGIEDDLFLVSASKFTEFFVSRHQHCLEFRVGIEIDLISVVRPNYLYFSCGESNFTRFLCGWSKLTWFPCGGFSLTWFQCLDRKWLSFCVGVEKYLVSVRIEINLVFVSGHRNRFYIRVGIGDY